jgi:hypothetical protein
MSDRLGLGYSKIAASEFQRSGWDRVRKAGLFFVAFVLIGIFFFYLTREIQVSTGHATGDSGVHWEQTSQ